jgi:hypothetical protein
VREFTGILVETLARNQRNVYNDAKTSYHRIRILEEDPSPHSNKKKPPQPAIKRKERLREKKGTLIKKNTKFSSYIRKLRWDRVQSHI